MNTYEKLIAKIQEEIPIIECELLSKTGCYGLYRDKIIFIEKKLNTLQKKSILAEEYAHYKTSVGTILNQNSKENRKQELKARNYALEYLVSIDDLIRCAEASLNNHYSCAEFLGIEIETLKNAITYYQEKFGTTYLYKEKILTFNDESVLILNADSQ